MNTQLLINAPPTEARPPAQRAAQPQEAREAAQTERTPPTEEPARVEEERGEDSQFGNALQTEVCRSHRLDKGAKTAHRPQAKGQWAATSALANRSKAIGRTLRGISELGIERPGPRGVTPSLVELNAAGAEFAGKVQEFARAQVDPATLGTNQADANSQLGDQLGDQLRAEMGDTTRDLQPKQAESDGDARQTQTNTKTAAAALSTASASTDDAGDDGADEDSRSFAARQQESAAAKISRALHKPGDGAKQFEERPATSASVRPAAEAAAIQEGAARVQTVARLIAGAGGDAPARVAKVAEQLTMMIARGTAKAQMELHPPDLGRVSLEIEVRGDQVLVKMVVESGEAQERLRADAEALAAALREQGMDLSGMEVSVGRGGQEADEEGAGAADSEERFRELMGEGPAEAAQDGREGWRWAHDGDLNLTA